jgi:hypothetical protein
MLPNLSFLSPVGSDSFVRDTIRGIMDGVLSEYEKMEQVLSRLEASNAYMGTWLLKAERELSNK